jgi:DNA-binding MarR family transcriptional regulator
MINEPSDALAAGVEAEARRFLRMRKAAQSEVGNGVLTPSAWVTMLALCSIDLRAKGCSIRTTAARANLPRNTTQRALLKLEQAGLVSISGDVKDHRAVSVQLTASGIGLMNRALVRMTTGVTRL